MENFEELRKKYNCFVFDDYKIMQEDNDTIDNPPRGTIYGFLEG